MGLIGAVTMADRSKRPVEEVMPGDHVLGHDGRPHTVVRTSVCPATSYLVLQVLGWALDLIIAESCEVLCLAGFSMGRWTFSWRAAGALKGTDAVLMEKAAPSLVRCNTGGLGIAKVAASGRQKENPFYALEIEENAGFFTNGFAVRCRP